MAFLYDLVFGMGVSTCVCILILALVIIIAAIVSSRNEHKNTIKVYEVIVRVYYDHDESVRFEYIQAKNKQDMWQELYDRYEECPHNYRVERVRKCK